MSAMNVKRSLNFIIIISVVYSLNNGISLCIAGNIDVKKDASPYEYIVEHTPDRLRILSERLFNSDLPKELVHLYAPVTAENELCRNQSILYEASLKKFDVWALKMWDSSGKIPAGILDAHFYDLGNFYECLKVSEIAPYHVKYCLIEIQNFLAPAIYHADVMRSKAILFGSINIIKDRLYLARCIPASCSNEDLESYYTSRVSQYNMSVVINENSCTASNENEPFNTWDWGVMAFLMITLVLLTAGTGVHKFTSNTEKRGVLTSFLLCYSLYINTNQIFTTKYLKTKLSFLSGLRGLAMILIILAHMAICTISIPKINYLQIAKDYSKPNLLFAMAATFNLAVEVFFVIGGLLISYLQIRNRKLGRTFNINLYFIRRLFRIIPPYFIQIALCITLIYRLGSGPLWKMNMGLPRENCLKNWWTNLLFINNYLHQDEMCIPTNWYLAVDMQLYIIAPVILFLMLKFKRLRNYAILLLILMTNMWTFYESYINEYRAGSMVDVKKRTEKTNQYIYITTQSRISSWLLGFYLGFILHELEEKSSMKRLSNVTLWIGWSLTVLVQILAVWSLFYLMSEHEYNVLFDSLFNGFHRTIFSASICWIIYACELGYGGFLYKFLTWYPLQVCGRLSFAAYLSQMIILNGIDSLTITSLQYQPIMDIRNAIANVLMVFVQSFFLSITFELPYANIGRVLSAGINGEDPLAKKDETKKENNTELNEKIV